MRRISGGVVWQDKVVHGYVEGQEKAIDRLSCGSGLVFLDDFPTDSIFKENEFVELDNGVYLNIVDKGSSERAVQGQTAIRCTVSLHGCLGKLERGNRSVDMMAHIPMVHIRFRSHTAIILQ